MRRVHEVVAVAVGVEELHLDFVDVDLLDGIGRAEAVLEHGAGAQVAQLGLDEGAQVAGRAVLDREHGVQIIVVLDDHAGTKLCGRDRHRDRNSPSTIAVCLAAGAEGGQATSSAATGLKRYFTRRLCWKGTMGRS